MKIDDFFNENENSMYNNSLILIILYHSSWNYRDKNMFIIRILITILKNSNIKKKNYIKTWILNESKEIKYCNKDQFA